MTATVDSANVAAITVASLSTTFSGSVTVGVSDNFLLVFALIWNPSVPSGVTFNGVALTKLSSGAGTDPDMVISVWSLANPSVGTFTLAGTGLTVSGGSLVYAVPMSGVNTTSPLGTASYTGNHTGTVTSVSTTATGAGANDVYVGAGYLTNATISNASGNMTNLTKNQAFQGQSGSVDWVAGTNTGLFSYTGTGGASVEGLAAGVAVIGSTAVAVTPTVPKDVFKSPNLGWFSNGIQGLMRPVARAISTGQTLPSFTGTIANQTYTQNTGIQTLNAAAFFTGATSYSLSPAPDTGISINSATGLISVNTATTVPGVHGSYLVNGINANGSVQSNAFTITENTAVTYGVSGPRVTSSTTGAGATYGVSGPTVTRDNPISKDLH